MFTVKQNEVLVVVCPYFWSLYVKVMIKNIFTKNAVVKFSSNKCCFLFQRLDQKIFKTVLNGCGKIMKKHSIDVMIFRFVPSKIKFFSPTKVFLNFCIAKLFGFCFLYNIFKDFFEIYSKVPEAIRKKIVVASEKFEHVLSNIK